MTEILTEDQDCVHLVVKRGHNGRVRFAMVTHSARLSGEVRLDVAGLSRNIIETRALDHILKLANELVINATSRLARLSGQDGSAASTERSSAAALRKAGAGVRRQERGYHG
jgi:hypothetical protein